MTSIESQSGPSLDVPEERQLRVECRRRRRWCSARDRNAFGHDSFENLRGEAEILKVKACARFETRHGCSLS